MRNYIFEESDTTEPDELSSDDRYSYDDMASDMDADETSSTNTWESK